MKYGKVASLLKKRKRIETFRATNTQWITEGYAAYPMYGMPELGRDNIFDLFGVGVDKRGDYAYAERECPEEINFYDADDDEKILERGRATVYFDGVEYEPLMSDTDAILIQPQYLAPFGDTDYELYERKGSYAQRYVAVKHGMALLGIIMPCRADEDLVDALCELCDNVRFSAKHEDCEQIGLDN